MSGHVRGDVRKAAAEAVASPAPLAGYFVAPDAYDDLWLWRERGNYPVPILARHALRDDPDVWDLVVAAAGPGPTEPDQ